VDALVWHGGPNLTVEQIDAPRPAEGEVLVDVALAGICGSDLHAYRGHGGKRQPPLVLGHEAVGRVHGESSLQALFPLRGCGRCAACASGTENLCSDRRLLGLDCQGTFAEQIAIAREDLVPVPDGVSAEIAALTEPLATALNALDGLALDATSRVAVIGLGTIGLLTVYAALDRGGQVVGVDPAPARRQHAEALGVTNLLSSAEELEPQSFTAVVDAVGVTATWSAGVRAVTNGGVIVIVGLGENVGPVDVGRLVRGGLTVRGTYAYTRDQFGSALQMLSERPPSMGWVQCLPLRDGASAFERLTSVSGDAAKVLLEVGSSSS
jgi:2-desacetyl-2-hydroxyethyl bacteriochlorophyllide A dehydrogenase